MHTAFGFEQMYNAPTASSNKGREGRGVISSKLYSTNSNTIV